MSDAGWIHPGPISPLDCDQDGCGWRVHGVPDKHHASALARHTAEAHQTARVSAREDILHGLCQLDESQPGDLTPEQLLDAYRAEVLAEAKTEVVAWLVKKARETTMWDVGVLASKVDRGAVRAFLGTGHFRDAMDAHRAEVLREAADLITSAQEQIERDEMAEHGFLDHETELQRDAVHYMAKLLRIKADEAVR